MFLSRAVLSRLWPLLILTACATYQQQSLQLSSGLATSLEQLHLKSSAEQQDLLPSWRERTVVVDDGLNEQEIALLAVLNNPHLLAVRTQMAEAAARLYAAGLLSDPQMGISLDFPNSHAPALTTGQNYSLGLDLQQLITHSARRDAAMESARATWLNILWQQWQVIEQSRMLYRRALIQQAQQAVAEKQYRQTKNIWQGQHKALLLGNATLDQQGLALASMMNAQVAADESKRQLNTSRHDLSLLIGLDPAVQLRLDAKAIEKHRMAPPVSDETLQSALDGLSEHRPDLLALQAGYHSQEQRVREQILSQFPSFSIGANSLRDTSGLWTLGPFINLSLPLFNGNRGNVAMVRATRKRLHDEYHDRLTSAYVQTRKMAQDYRLAFAEWAALNAQLPKLADTVKRMAHALQAGEINMLTFTTLHTAYFSQQARVLMLEQTLLEQQVALETLTGALLPIPASNKVNAAPSIQQEHQP